MLLSGVRYALAPEATNPQQDMQDNELQQSTVR